MLAKKLFVLSFLSVVISVTESRLISANLETWMSDLPQNLRDTPIIHLAIPGSHDSGTYAITGASEVAPDADDILKELEFLGPFLTEVMAKWSLTQQYSLKEQIEAGIRYLDLRIATKNNTENFYFVHGLYSAEVSQELKDINSFLESQPNEIVILDCQHFYALSDDDHKRFKELLYTIFGAKLLPHSYNMADVTLNTMAEDKRQVVLIYRESPTDVEDMFWDAAFFPTPWANTMSASDLINFLNDNLKTRDDSLGYVSQCILTPDVATIIGHLTSDLKTECFLALEEEKYKWLSEQTPGPGGVNIIISDFVDYEDNEFSQTVINLNQKLLK